MAAPGNESDALTQIIYLTIAIEAQIGHANSPAGQQWSKALDLVQSCDGLDRLYWGRRLEEPQKVQIHLVWRGSRHSDAFMTAGFGAFRSLVKDLIEGGDDSSIHTRLTTLHHQAMEDPFGPSLLGRPIGTAIYKGTDVSWHEGAWPLWTHVVSSVDGCRGIAGGDVREPVEGVERCYVVYVAWDSVAQHENYHRSEHFRKHQVILAIGHQGWTEYGHVLFEEIRYVNGGVNRL